MLMAKYADATAHEISRSTLTPHRSLPPSQHPPHNSPHNYLHTHSYSLDNCTSHRNTPVLALSPAQTLIPEHPVLSHSPSAMPVGTQSRLSDRGLCSGYGLIGVVERVALRHGRRIGQGRWKTVCGLGVQCRRRDQRKLDNPADNLRGGEGGPFP